MADLAEQPRPRGCRPLKGFDGVWRLRVGNDRTCCSDDDGQLVILVITISTRDDVYEIVHRLIR